MSSSETPRVGSSKKPGRPSFGKRARDDALQVERLLTVGHVRDRNTVELPGAAADDEVSVAPDVPGEARTRGDVVEIALVAPEDAVAGVDRDRVRGERRHVVRDATHGVERRVGATLAAIRRGERAPVDVPADAEVDHEVVADTPVVTEPHRPRRSRDVDAPIAGVFVVAERDVIETGEIPLRRIVRTRPREIAPRDCRGET